MTTQILINTGILVGMLALLLSFFSRNFMVVYKTALILSTYIFLAGTYQTFHYEDPQIRLVFLFGAIVGAVTGGVMIWNKRRLDEAIGLLLNKLNLSHEELKRLLMKLLFWDRRN